MEDIDFGGFELTQGCAVISDRLAAFDGFQCRDDFGSRLIEGSGLGGFVGGDFHEVPAEAGADEAWLVRGQRENRRGEIRRQAAA